MTKVSTMRKTAAATAAPAAELAGSSDPPLSELSDEDLHRRIDVLEREAEALRPGMAGALQTVYRQDALARVAELEALAERALAFRLGELRQEIARRPLTLGDLTGCADLLAAGEYCARLRAAIEGPAAEGSFDLLSDRDKDADATRRAELDAAVDVLQRELTRRGLERRKAETEAELAELEKATT